MNADEASTPVSPDHVTSEHPPRSSRKRTLLIALAIIAVFVVVALGARWVAKSGGDKRGGRPPAAVNIAPATKADMPVTVAALGTVQPLVTATVRTQLSGVLFKIMFQEGQMVRQGQVLAQIDPRPYRLALEQARANLARDEAQLTSARLDLNRYQTLLKQDSIASQQVDTQRATVGQLAGTVAADRAAIGTAALNLDYTAIKAPISGRVGIRQVDIGNYLTPSDTNGVVIITQVDPIDVSFALPQAQLSAIGQTAGAGSGLPVDANDQNNGNRLATGRFLTFDNQVDATTGTVKAKARFANAGNVLFPGAFVNVSMLVQTLHDVVTVPVSAVRHGSQGDFVFVVKPDNTVKLTVVKTGPSSGDKLAILSGLTAGTQVVIEGADGLEDGASINKGGKRGGGQGNGGGGGQGGNGHHRRGANAGNAG
ncbi:MULTISPECIES: efflux RND transporter periplasmic adaptor subunit [unclassified Novosphingobium]|uniref:efflux RND transporter periplasmic adaptor subunit n=1 Tax=unclassified Novosphingobium TaxID=2644732 RepID=UPI00149474A0|nr:MULTISPECIES: efflux RND transporter periplasmic adaptor subunit [unclassified Novosphingobium]MBB3357305.1 multidrug efflux system membrane fusion protein [Novosphingobium sp. BK256]MBB3374033.1 multidrug efflux system membrane fusion protein [Novosphingobium sp. BK280]MBB3378445.1 multidrug efflux system membrane fusion protein [Novosphingobium sp. BK258]MBB3419771.1 multidrug efflux system membrane fusion protein [Novosphingobium sp. BK267]MBB3447908.1 multidrug efflux system membrane fu